MSLPLGESFGAALAASGKRVICHCEPRAEAAARDYLDLIECDRADVRVCRDGLPLAELEEELPGDDIPLIVLAALDRELKDHFFRHLRLHLFADHHYMPCPGHASPELFTVGTTAAAIARLAAEVPADRRAAGVARRRAALHEGARPPGHDRLGDAMRSPAIREVRIHGLGPPGTNIARACDELVARERIAAKATVIIHGRKVEPPDYAAIAASESRPGVLPLHVECAVFYGLCDLFDQRPREVIFAGHLYLPLDTMQLACRPAFAAEHPRPGGLVIASHPSPLALVSRLLESGAARHTPASSNSDAAEMVRLGDADLCITTETGSRLAQLRTLHRFGAPTMLFTIGASTTSAALDDLATRAPDRSAAVSRQALRSV